MSLILYHLGEIITFLEDLNVKYVSYWNKCNAYKQDIFQSFEMIENTEVISLERTYVSNICN